MRYPHCPAESERKRTICRAVVLAAGVLLAFLAASGAPAGHARATDLSHMSASQLESAADRLVAAGRTDSAAVVYGIAASRFERSMSDAEKARMVAVHSKLARIFYEKSDLVNTLRILGNALRIAESIPNDTLTLRLLNDIGPIYLAFKHYERAASYFERALAVNGRVGDDNSEFMILNNLAGVRTLLGDAAGARECLGRMRSLRLTDASLRAAAPYHTLLLQGVIDNMTGHFGAGVTDISRAIDYASARGMGPSAECFALEELAKSYRGSGDTPAALVALRRYLLSARRAGNKEKEADALDQLRTLHRLAGNADSAAYYQNRYLTLADSVLNIHDFARINDSLFFYETSKYESEIADLQLESLLRNKRIRLQTWIIVSVVAVALCIGALLVLVLVQKRRLRRSYDLLFKANAMLVEAERSRRTARRNAGRGDDASTDVPAEGQQESPARGTATLGEEKSDEIAERIHTVMCESDAPCSPDFCLKGLAELTGTNSHYVSQVVNDVFGVNFTTLLNRRRIAIVKERLIDTANYGHLTIQSISAGVGYRNQTSFIRAFKNEVGMTPSMFLRLARQQQQSRSNETPDNQEDA